MNILHYSIGLNQDRGGGLTKYSTDLAIKENKENHVSLIYPGELKVFNKKVNIKREGKRLGIDCYSVINPLPIPFLCGLSDEKYLNSQTGIDIWLSFFKKEKPDIIHVHTLIGLYPEFLMAAKKVNIPILYTVHDYFGICPKQRLVYNGETCQKWDTCEDCTTCNSVAIKGWKLFFFHSRLFLTLRKMKAVKKIGGIYKSSKESNIHYVRKSIDYKLLQNHFFELFKLFDYIHYNSNITKNVFENIVNPMQPSQVVSIYHSDIVDNRRLKEYTDKVLKLVYLGPPQNDKGYFFLVDLVKDIKKTHSDFKLITYTGIDNDIDCIEDRGPGYRYNDLPFIMEDCDLLVVPSLWYETFGFIVVEALSYGVPVLSTPTVGASDVIKEIQGGFVISCEEWKSKIIGLIENRNELMTANRNIIFSKFKNFNDHVNEMMLLYDAIINLVG